MNEHKCVTKRDEEGPLLILVTFESQKEVVSFYKHFSKQKKQQFLLQLDGHSISIQSVEELFFEKDRQHLIQLFIDYIKKNYEKKWLLEYIVDTFYFKDVHEQMEILDIAEEILNGEKNEIPQVTTLPSRQTLLYEALSDVIKDSSTFLFESLMTFRLTAYKNLLLRVVELSIDEYKLQQEYHLFVDKLRGIVKSYKPLHKTIHVVDEKPFVLFDDKLQELSHIQNIRSFYPILKQWGIETEPSIIVTLIGLAPETIHIYTDRQELAMMQTIQNVFEERVIFHPLIASGPLKNLHL